MKKLLIIIAGATLFASCGKKEQECIVTNDDGNVKITFINKTDRDLEGITVGGCYLPYLEVEEKSCEQHFSEFGFDGSLPDEICGAEYNGKELESFNQFYFCGTEKHDVTEGTFVMELRIAEMDDEEYLKLELK